MVAVGDGESRGMDGSGSVGADTAGTGAGADLGGSGGTDGNGSTGGIGSGSGSADANTYEHEVCEYVRPATSALGKFAPENEFHAGGRRVSIDRIDLRVSEIET